MAVYSLLTTKWHGVLQKTSYCFLWSTGARDMIQRVNSTILEHADFKYDVTFSVIFSEKNYNHFVKNLIAVETSKNMCLKLL